MIDLDETPQPTKKVVTYGRNDIVKVCRGTEELLIKYKKLDFYRSNGYELYEK